MTVTVNRSNDPSYTALFDDLIKESFGFSFEPWLARNLWDERYESHAVIENGKMLANVCIYKTDMIVCGQPVRTHQFGAVATRAHERGKGLSQLLINHVLREYPDTPAFLAANPSVVDFYPRFGFRPVQTYRPMVDVTINNCADIGLEYSPDAECVRSALYGNRVYSSLVDSVNTQSVEIFHMLMEYEGSIYLLPDCGAIIIGQQADNILFLAHVISAKPITFDDLIKELPFSGITCVAFGFCPDWLGVNPRWVLSDELYFIKGPWDLPARFCFPAMSAT